MKRLLLSLLCFLGVLSAQDTFSIVAVDPVTGEVGSAGASCVAGCNIIADLHPGVGAINSQSYYLAGNQDNASDWMDLGFSPQQILDSVVANDVQNDSTLRQYGVVDLVGGGRSANFTGSNCLAYAGGVTGPTYAIQGNILLGQQIIDTMEYAFLNTSGSLAERLMATLQAANIPGADSRCLGSGRPAISAFVQVARPGDTTGNYYCNLAVLFTTSSQQPIDTLQGMFDDWLMTTDREKATDPKPYQVYPNPIQDRWMVEAIEGESGAEIVVYDLPGRILRVEPLPKTGKLEFGRENLSAGTYLFAIRSREGALLQSGKLIFE